MGLFDRFRKKEEFIPSKDWYDKTIYLDNQEHEDEFLKYYRRDLGKTDWYTKTAKELREDHDGERVYKYYPLKLPYKIEGTDVYSYMKENKWVKIGSVSEDDKEKILNNTTKFSFHANVYKEVDDKIEVVEDDPFFSFYVKKKK